MTKSGARRSVEVFKLEIEIQQEKAIGESRRLYLDLMKNTLTRYSFGEAYREIIYRRGSLQRFIMAPVQSIMRLKGYVLCKPGMFSRELREGGEDWPSEAETMIGLKRLDNIQFCVTQALADGVLGDLIETGVWRGGAAIFMRAILKSVGSDRSVWLADSFEGLPKPNIAEYPADAAELRKEGFWKFDQLAVSEEQVKINFEKYGLLDSQVKFLKGWFRDTLPTIPADQKFAVIRLDGDLYESTWDALSNLYQKLSPRGYCIVDDYGGIPACAKAVEDYRQSQGITSPILKVDKTGVFWRK